MRSALARRSRIGVARSLVLAMVLSVFVALQGGVASALPPANDSIENATVITTLPFNAVQAMTDTTHSASDPSATCVFGAPPTVWYRYDAPADGLLRVGASSQFGVTLVTYTGSPGSLTQVACGGSTAIPAVVPVSAGSSYYFMIAASTSATVTLSVQVATPPANDLIENATAITTLPYNTVQTMVDATHSPTDPTTCVGANFATVWYRYDAPTDGLLRVSGSSQVGASLATYAGSLGSLNQVTCGQLSTVFPIVIPLTGGTSYYFMVASSIPAPVTLSIQVPTPPANDLIENAAVITALPFDTVQTMTDATRSASDPSATCIGAAPTVWYRYDAPADGLLRLSATSQVGATLASYTGSPDSLTQVGCANGTQLVPVTAGTTYYFMVTSFILAPVTLHVQVATPPANDLIENATVIPSVPFNTTQSTTDATPSATDPAVSCFGSGSVSTVWFRYDATTTQPLRITPSGSGAQRLVVFRGAPDSLTEVACGGAQIVRVTAGETYYLMVIGQLGSPASLTLDIQVATPPANDLIENATPIGGLPSTVSGNTVDASHESTDPFMSCVGGQTLTVWYRYDAPATQLLRLTYTPQSFSGGGGVAVYRDTPFGLTQVGCTNQPVATVTLTGGHTYYFLVAQFFPMTFSLKVELLDTYPTVTVPGDITVEAESPSGTIVDFTPTASDAEDGALAVFCNNSPGSTFGLGDTTVDCAATDSFGLSSHASFTVHVVDTTMPVLSVPAAVNADATSPTGAIVSFTASATDIADSNPTVVCEPPSDSAFSIGDTDVNCVATDASGNSAVGSFTVHVNSASEQLSNLRTTVLTETTGGLRGSLDSKLRDAQAGLAAGNTAKACGSLTEFVGLVQAQSGKAIPVTTAQQLVADATRIKAVIGCKK